MVRWVVGSILHGVDPLSYFSIKPVLHDWCNKGRDMCYPVCGMVHTKEPLLLVRKSSICGSSGFSFSLPYLFQSKKDNLLNTIFTNTNRITLVGEFFKIYILRLNRYFSFQPVIHDWCTKGRGMCYPVCGMVHIKKNHAANQKE